MANEKIEEHDKVSLSNPEKEIINKGGKIFYAKFKNNIVGTVSLIKIDNSTFEIAKMAVTEKFQGQGIGKKLLDHSISQAKKMGIKNLILYSNTILANALNLYFKSGFIVVPLDHSQYKRSNIKMELQLHSV